MAGPDQPFLIREARPSDWSIVVEYNLRLAAETEGKSLDPNVLELGVKRALAEPDRLRYWVAVDPLADRPIGQAAISREWSDWRNGWLWWFQSVYVSAPFRAQGVFRALYRQVRDAALASKDVIGLRLYVDEANERAQHAYAALGMRPGGYLVYEELWPERFNSARG